MKKPLPFKSEGAPDVEALAAVFKALGDPVRLKILGLLGQCGVTCCELVGAKEVGLCACDVESAVGLSQAAVSHHLAVLTRAGLVSADKRGRWVFYQRNDETLKRLGKLLPGCC